MFLYDISRSVSSLLSRTKSPLSWPTAIVFSLKIVGFIVFFIALCKFLDCFKECLVCAPCKTRADRNAA